MEALCGVTAALLCIYDLAKGIDPVLRIGEIKLEVKEGGKSGQWLHPGSELAKKLIAPKNTVQEKILEGMNSVVLILSDRCSQGEAVDRSGPVAEHWLTERGAKVI